MLAKDVMTREVITVKPETAVRDIAATLLERHISAVPVSADGRSVIGIVSEGDLMRRPEADTDGTPRSWWLNLFGGTDDLASEFRKTHGRTAADVMTKNPIVVDETMPVAEVARTMEKNGIKRVPVVRDGALVGIVSRANLLRELATRPDASLAPLSKPDGDIRERFMAVLADQGWADRSLINATVSNGVVHLWGLARTREQAEAYGVAARGITGVKGVENHIGLIGHNYYWAE